MADGFGEWMDLLAFLVLLTLSSNRSTPYANPVRVKRASSKAQFSQMKPHNSISVSYITVAIVPGD